MKITIELNTETAQSKMECTALFSFITGFLASQIDEETSSSEQTLEAREEQDEPTIEAVAVAAPTTEKPKRQSRKKKVDEKPATEAPTDSVIDAPDELPFQPTDFSTYNEEDVKQSKEPEVVQQAPQTPVANAEPVDVPAASGNGPKCTAVEFRAYLSAKKQQLKLGEGGENYSKLAEFNDFVHRLSEAYGNRLPSKLSDEARGRFIKEFNSISIENGVFKTNDLPF